MDQELLIYIAIGFAAQLIDGTLGMAYGVASTTALVATGMPPAIASANVHVAEIFTTATSGTAHAIVKNIDWRMFRRLAIAGAVGGLIGATLVSKVDLSGVRVVIAAYLFIMGLIVIGKALKRAPAIKRAERHLIPLGLFGGFFDAAGGGGWGPIVASNLIARGNAPATVIGTVNAAEFAMTVAASIAFLAALGPNFGKAALGLLIGGMLAAPLAAIAAKKAPRRVFMGFVGALICAMSAYTFARALA